MYASIGATTPTVLFATDAQGFDDSDDCGGYGIVATDISRLELREALLNGMKSGYSITKLDGTFTGRRRAEEPWRRTVPHSRMPASILDRSADRWVTIAAGRWARADPIALGEGRAVVKLTRALAATESAHCSKVLSMQDNMSVLGCFTKGRSPAPSLNLLARQRAAAALFGDIRVVLPWVQTAKQAADGASRMLPTGGGTTTGPPPSGQDFGTVTATLSGSGEMFW